MKLSKIAFDHIPHVVRLSETLFDDIPPIVELSWMQSDGIPSVVILIETLSDDFSATLKHIFSKSLTFLLSYSCLMTFRPLWSSRRR